MENSIEKCKTEIEKILSVFFNDSASKLNSVEMENCILKQKIEELEKCVAKLTNENENLKANRKQSQKEKCRNCRTKGKLRLFQNLENFSSPVSNEVLIPDTYLLGFNGDFVNEPINEGLYSRITEESLNRHSRKLDFPFNSRDSFKREEYDKIEQSANCLTKEPFDPDETFIDFDEKDVNEAFSDTVIKGADFDDFHASDIVRKPLSIEENDENEQFHHLSPDNKSVGKSKTFDPDETVLEIADFDTQIIDIDVNETNVVKQVIPISDSDKAAMVPTIFKFQEPTIRKKDERRKLPGFDCVECREYYASLGQTDSQIDEQIQKCSRHRYRFALPTTPEGYWNVSLPHDHKNGPVKRISLKTRRFRPLRVPDRDGWN